MKRGLVSTLLVCVLAAGCQGPESGEVVSKVEDAAAAKPTPAPAAKEEDVQSKLEEVLKKDMAYADLRAAVLARGWKPVATAQCKKNVGGDGAICDHLPELESCSGDGYCISHFENQAGERLDVTSYGMSEDWNVVGDDSRFNVVEWSFAKASES
jgi:hypothetical protein